MSELPSPVTSPVASPELTIRYETKTVLRAWYELGMYEGWELCGYTEYGIDGTPRMAEIRRKRQ